MPDRIRDFAYDKQNNTYFYFYLIAGPSLGVFSRKKNLDVIQIYQNH